MTKPNPKQTLAQQALAAAIKALQDNPDLVDKAVEKGTEIVERVRKENPEVDRAITKAEEIVRDTWEKAPPHVQAAASVAAGMAKDKARGMAKEHGVDKVAERAANKVKEQAEEAAAQSHRALAVKAGVVLAGLAVVYYLEQQRRNRD